MPPYQVQPCDAAHAQGIANANMRAFNQDPHWRLVWPKTLTIEEIIDGNANRLPKQLSNSRETTRHEMAVDTETGEVVGYARWEFLHCPGSEALWKEAQTKEPTEEEAMEYEKSFKLHTDEEGRTKYVNREITSSYGKILHNETQKVVGGRPFLELDHLGTLPSHGRRGVGGMLLDRGVAQANALGLPIFVMAYPHGTGLYTKHGFKLMSTVTLDYSKYSDIGPQTVSFFVKEPTS
ncbi:hypothetical protein BP5796_06237 [Coleophoma crateriformis]|uniref:N-acetyltransferase domain-containing protein n=1 Tax=Coleophoma crateriformis TaxID=565419 RepID=A0A3D8RWI8_9HELO|nr:hypothetical protein BP5796_06237 [Coleophoma crateriformis]